MGGEALQSSPTCQKHRWKGSIIDWDRRLIWIGAELDVRAEGHELMLENSRLAEDIVLVKGDVTQVKTILEDAEHKFEAFEATLGTNTNRAEVWDVYNAISDVRHRALVNFNTSPSEWKTLCGWLFARQTHARTNSQEHQVPSSHRSCPRSTQMPIQIHLRNAPRPHQKISCRRLGPYGRSSAGVDTRQIRWVKNGLGVQYITPAIF